LLNVIKEKTIKMSEYKFRVLIDAQEEEEIFRDIVINSNATFELLHTAIINAFSFSGNQMASFYLSDDDWNKGDEIGLMDMSGEGQKFNLMNKTLINKLVTAKGEKLLYVYDFLNMWCFYVELVAINPIDEEERYPYLELSFGEAPEEDSKNIMGDVSEEETTSSFYDDYDDDYDDGDMKFENIDDYDF
jgi:hypothetical protein